jgi:hypothetical protein
MQWIVIGTGRRELPPRHRKKRIASLVGPEGRVQETKEMLKIVEGFYKKKFKYESRDHFCLGEDFWDSEDKLLVDEVLDLESPFSEEEIKEAIFSCYPEGAPRPDGMSFSFIRNSRV